MGLTIHDINWAKNGRILTNCNQNIDEFKDNFLEWQIDVTVSNQSNDNCIVVYWKHNGVGYYIVACMGFPTGRYPDAGVSVDVKYQEGSYTDLQAFPCTGLQACHQLGDQLP